MPFYQIEFRPNPVQVANEDKAAVRDHLRSIRALIGSDIIVTPIDEQIIIEPAT